MPTDPSPPDPAAPAGWAALVDELLVGLAHTLNNRVAGVQAVHTLLSDGDPPDRALLDALAAEAERLAATTRHLRALPGRATRTPIPQLLPDALRRAADILGEHDTLRYLPVRVVADPATPPVLADEAALLHLLLLVLAAAGRAALALRDGSVEVATAPDGEEHVAVRIATAGDGAGVDVPRGGLHREDAARLAAAAGAALAEVEETDAASVRYRLRFPTLAAARRADRG